MPETKYINDKDLLVRKLFNLRDAFTNLASNIVLYIFLKEKYLTSNIRISPKEFF